jgi:hypothetical protein
MTGQALLLIFMQWNYRQNVHCGGAKFKTQL